MNKRMRKKWKKWRLPPRARGLLTVGEAAMVLPRLIQRLKSRNEAWVVTGTGPVHETCVLLSARYYWARNRSTR